MKTREISTLKINTLVSQEQYDKAYDENKIEQDSIYLVPDNTEEIAQQKADEALQSAKEYTDTAVSNKANTSDLTSHTEDTTIHVTEEDKSKWNAKADSEHSHDDVYYTETEVDAKFTTVNQSIDTLNSEVETVKATLLLMLLLLIHNLKQLEVNLHKQILTHLQQQKNIQMQIKVLQ